MGFPKIGSTSLGGPHNKDYNFSWSILGSVYFGKLPFAQNDKPMAATPSPLTSSQDLGIGMLQNIGLLGALRDNDTLRGYNFGHSLR